MSFQSNWLFSNKPFYLKSETTKQWLQIAVPVSQKSHLICGWDDQAGFPHGYKNLMQIMLRSEFHLDQESTVSNSFAAVNSEFSKQFSIPPALIWPWPGAVFSFHESCDQRKRNRSQAASARTKASSNLMDRSHFCFHDFYLSKGLVGGRGGG